jgi:hypothetical protein
MNDGGVFHGPPTKPAGRDRPASLGQRPHQLPGNRPRLFDRVGFHGSQSEAVHVARVDAVSVNGEAFAEAEDLHGGVPQVARSRLPCSPGAFS